MRLEQWSVFLYYPLGLLPSIFFFLRFFIQWIRSEKRKQSIVDSTFWQLSLYGNVLLTLHYFIQLQYLFLMIQVINIGISWRNLNLIKDKKKPLPIRSMLGFMLMIGGISGTFFIYKHLFFDCFDLLASPLGMRQGQQAASLGIAWKIVGIAGSFLFASRFWVQWWESEKEGKSELGVAFWILSLIGSLLSLIYCFLIQDRVSLIHYAFGLIPYIRNLFLQRRSVRYS